MDTSDSSACRSGPKESVPVSSFGAASQRERKSNSAFHAMLLLNWGRLRPHLDGLRSCTRGRQKKLQTTTDTDTLTPSTLVVGPDTFQCIRFNLIRIRYLARLLHCHSPSEVGK